MKNTGLHVKIIIINSGIVPWCVCGGGGGGGVCQCLPVQIQVHYGMVSHLTMTGLISIYLINSGTGPR